ncbi:MAG: transglycosylase domain-containing protein [Schaalia hyovaginalis]|uniref:transglycosylase domain-containing protein n=1 Tax=Schaalia hyovaginalis TaxID=29316 RepID=UPI0023F6EB11|nr:transglycosylase domain-containing protein [Schaalia hyovaginalis]MCI7671489.1 transglycosylase domain-containing protein [Schaalia hyovaginalis]MDY5507122.1 transglycosylase domain-containing protein [Schaalia hyovaginalis]
MAKSDGKKDWSEIMGSGSAHPHLPTRAETRGRRSGGKAPSRRASGAGSKTAAGAKRKRGIGKKIGLGLVFTFLTVLIAGLAAFLYMYASIAIPKADDLALAQKTTIYYSDGQTELGDLGEVDRQIIDASTLPDYVGKAIVASEDRTFYTNSGIDPKGILRALYNNITTGSRQGGSTLTQQYVERYYVGQTTSYIGKAEEAVLALKINREQSKDEILGNYLNTIYFGRRTYGIEAAAKAYFGHSAKDLTLSEAALLAGIIPAPSAWDPAVDPDQAKSRWARVLDLMVEDGWISQAEADAAEFPETIDPATLNSSSMTGPLGYLIEQVQTELISAGVVDEDTIFNGGLKIVSTIDKAKQDAAIAAANSMKEVEGWDPRFQHLALSSIDPNTGEIVAEFAGYDYEVRQQNSATQDIAMAGSSFKPFALLANARAGGSVHDRYDGNSPKSFEGLTSLVANNGGTSYGSVDLITSTGWSINTAYVALNKEVGPAATMQAAIDAGIPEDTAGLEASLLNVLGFASPHNVDLANAFATIANGGERMTAHIVKTASDSHGNLLYEAAKTGERAFDVEEVSSIMPALRAVTGANGSAWKVGSALPGIETAGKTGTSSDQLSAQFSGFVPGLATTVSMYQSDENGNAVPLTNIGGLDHFYGADWATDVWIAYMTQATQGMTTTTFDWVVPSTRTPKNSVPEQAQSAQTAPAAPTETEQPPTDATTPAPVPSTPIAPEAPADSGQDEVDPAPDPNAGGENEAVQPDNGDNGAVKPNAGAAG